MARLLRQYRPGERVRAVETVVFGTGEEVVEGTIGHIQQTNVGGCSPLVTVAWEGRGGAGEPPAILHPVSAESLEPVGHASVQDSAKGYVGGGRHEPGGLLDPHDRDKG